jgi:hypothetical protein
LKAFFRNVIVTALMGVFISDFRNSMFYECVFGMIWSNVRLSDSDGENLEKFCVLPRTEV